MLVLFLRLLIAIVNVFVIGIAVVIAIANAYGVALHMAFKVS